MNTQIDPPASPTPSNNDEIFVVKPEPKEPVSKKTVWLTVVLTLLGIIVLIVVFMFAIIGSAGSLADDYRRSALVQVQKVDKPLKDLEPSRVLNNRNIDPPINKIYISEQSQPSLENTLFVGDLSSKYVVAKKQQAIIATHNSALDKYTTQLGQLLKFDDAMQVVTVQEVDVISKLNTNDSLSLRSASGNYQDFADQIKKLEAPDQLKVLQKELVKNYQTRASLYTKWAVAMETGDKATIGTLQTQLQTRKDKAASEVTDKNLILLFTPSYQKLVTQQKTLETALSN
jgi:hypothetical protein